MRKHLFKKIKPSKYFLNRIYFHKTSTSLGFADFQNAILVEHELNQP